MELTMWIAESSCPLIPLSLQGKKADPLCSLPFSRTVRAVSGSGCGLRSGARLGVDPSSDLQRTWKLSAAVFSFHNLLYRLMKDVCELLVTVTAVLKKG